MNRNKFYAFASVIVMAAVMVAFLLTAGAVMAGGGVWVVPDSTTVAAGSSVGFTADWVGAGVPYTITAPFMSPLVVTEATPVTFTVDVVDTASSGVKNLEFTFEDADGYTVTYPVDITVTTDAPAVLVSYEMVVNPMPVYAGVSTTLELSPAVPADAIVSIAVNSESGGELAKSDAPFLTVAFPATGTYTVGAVVADLASGDVVSYTGEVEVMDAPARSGALFAAVQAVVSQLSSELATPGINAAKADRIVDLLTQCKNLLKLVVNGAAVSPEGGSIALRPVQPQVAVEPTCDVNYAWGRGYVNPNGVLGVGTNLFSGVFYTSTQPGGFGSCKPITGSGWISSRYTPTVELNADNYTATFTNTLWADSDSNGMYDLLVLGEPWNGRPVSLTFSYPDTVTPTYTETWNLAVGMTPTLITSTGISPVPTTVYSGVVPFEVLGLAAANPSAHLLIGRVGVGFDVSPTLGLSDTVLFGGYYGGSDLGLVCNSSCTVTYAGKNYKATDADKNGLWDVFLPGKAAPGPWSFTVTAAGRPDEEWIIFLADGKE